MDIVKTLSESPQFSHLKREIIEICGKTILVLEQCGVTDSRMGRIDTEIKLDAAISEFVTPDEKLGLSAMYVRMASTSFGDVPTFLEFIAMRSPDASVWLETCTRVNPQMFTWIEEMAKAIEQVNDEMRKEEESKKK